MLLGNDPVRILRGPRDRKGYGVSGSWTEGEGYVSPGVRNNRRIAAEKAQKKKRDADARVKSYGDDWRPVSEPRENDGWFSGMLRRPYGALAEVFDRDYGRNVEAYKRAQAATQDVDTTPSSSIGDLPEPTGGGGKFRGAGSTTSWDETAPTPSGEFGSSTPGEAGTGGTATEDVQVDGLEEDPVKGLANWRRRRGGARRPPAATGDATLSYEVNTEESRRRTADEMRTAAHELQKQGMYGAVKGQEQYNELTRQTEYLGRLADEYKDASKRAFDDSMAEVRKLQKLGDQITNMAPQPGRLFLSAHGAATFASALSIAAGAMNSARFGGKNTALAIIEGAIERDLEAQQTAQLNARAGAQLQRGVFHDMLEVYKSDRIAKHAYLNMQYMLAAKEMKKISATWDSLIMKSKADQLAAEMNAKANHNMMLAGRVMVNQKVSYLAGNAEQRLREALGGLPIRNVDEIMRAYSADNASTRLQATLQGIQTLQEQNLIGAEQAKKLVEIARSEMSTAAAIDRHADSLESPLNYRTKGSSPVGRGGRAAPPASGTAAPGSPPAPSGDTPSDSSQTNQGSQTTNRNRASVGKQGRLRQSPSQDQTPEQKLAKVNEAIKAAEDTQDPMLANSLPRLKEEKAALEQQVLERRAIQAEQRNETYAQSPLTNRGVRVLSRAVGDSPNRAKGLAKGLKDLVQGTKMESWSPEKIWQDMVVRHFPPTLRYRDLKGDIQTMTTKGVPRTMPTTDVGIRNALEAMNVISTGLGASGIPNAMLTRIAAGDPVLATKEVRGAGTFPAVILNTREGGSDRTGLQSGALTLRVTPSSVGRPKNITESAYRAWAKKNGVWSQQLTVPVLADRSAVKQAKKRGVVFGRVDQKAVPLDQALLRRAVPDRAQRQKLAQQMRFFPNAKQREKFREQLADGNQVRDMLGMLSVLSRLNKRQGTAARAAVRLTDNNNVVVDLKKLEQAGDLGGGMNGRALAASLRKRRKRIEQQVKKALGVEGTGRDAVRGSDDKFTVATQLMRDLVVGKLNQISGRGVPQRFEAEQFERSLGDPADILQWNKNTQAAYNTALGFIDQNAGDRALLMYTIPSQAMSE